jgi:hypothetical protein
MRWHPATGLGTIVLANSTYARAGALAGEMLAALVEHGLVADHAQTAARLPGYRMSGPVPAPGEPWPETLAARDIVDRLLQDWDDETAARLFAPNVDQDRPFPQRLADIARLRERIGAFRPDPARPAECDSPAHCRWWLAGEHGRASVQIRLAPLRQMLVQQLVVAVPPAQGSPLERAVRLLAAAVHDGGPQWPAGLEASVETAPVLRQLRLAGAWTGPCEPGGWLAGDGATTATIELTGPDGRASLTVAVGGPDQLLVRADCALLSSQAAV